MIERVEVLSREELLLQTLTNLIREVVAGGSAHYNIVIAEVYAEGSALDLLLSSKEGVQTQTD